MNTDKKAITNSIEIAWSRRAGSIGYKPGSAAYRKAECEFFAGAMAALCAVDPQADNTMSPLVPPVWVLNIMSGRPVVE